MQSYLKDILANPPFQLGRKANFLLLVATMLLASIFFVREEHPELTLNVMDIGSTETTLDGKVQVAKATFVQLYPRIKEGQEISKGDTLFSMRSKSDLQTLDTWRTKLQAHAFLPTADLLKHPLVSSVLKEKMIALAKAQDADKKYRAKGNSSAKEAEDRKRLTVVESIISNQKQEVRKLKSAIPKFEQLEKSWRNKFDAAGVAYAAGALSVADLKKARRKLDESILDTKQRKGQLQTAELKVREYESERTSLKKGLRAVAKKQLPKADHIVFETDLMISLDSLWASSFVLAEYAGEVNTVGSLLNVSVGDTVLVLAGEKQLSHGSKTLFAEAVSRKTKNIYIGSDLYIRLQTGEKVAGRIVSVNDTSTLGRYQYEITAADALTIDEINEILVPSKNVNFIEKVMENF